MKRWAARERRRLLWSSDGVQREKRGERGQRRNSGEGDEEGGTVHSDIGGREPGPLQVVVRHFIRDLFDAPCESDAGAW